jgi:deazaflavin-dependent oxidoreductase (nitroreductase family)
MRAMPLTQRLGRLPWFGSPAAARAGRMFLPPVDTAAQRLTGGRLSIANAIGLPLALLTTIGRRTGLPRRTPVTYARDGADLLVVGSNWGRPQHPDWALNLRAQPDASIEIRGRRVSVTARLLQGAERAEAWKLLIGVWSHFDAYERRAGGRELHVFRLTER